MKERLRLWERSGWVGREGMNKKQEQKRNISISVSEKGGDDKYIPIFCSCFYDLCSLEKPKSQGQCDTLVMPFLSPDIFWRSYFE